jgi:hypothetical protein
MRRTYTYVAERLATHSGPASLLSNEELASQTGTQIVLKGYRRLWPSREGTTDALTPRPLPAGSTATRARVAKLKCNYENEQQN